MDESEKVTIFYHDIHQKLQKKSSILKTGLSRSMYMSDFSSRSQKKRNINPPLAKTNDVLNFLVEIDRKLRRKQMTVKEDSNNQETGKDLNNKNSSTSVNRGPRKWFHVSDSSVTEVNEEKVLRSQAYLLFYERTL